MKRGCYIRLKRVYDPPTLEDGERFLVDRLWPRGKTRSELKLTGWLKELAPSTALRSWFGHKPERWAEFQARYRKELLEKRDLLYRIALSAQKNTVTLLYSSRDETHNNAVVLKQVLEEIIATNTFRDQ